MYILPEPPENVEERDRTVSLALSVSKTHDGDTLQFEEVMSGMQQMYAYETGPGGWVYIGPSGEDTEQSLATDKEEGAKFQYLSARPPLVPAQ